ncbi:helix-turn-helix domain-containing protein [Roseateles asaccharophilus]|uniref:AcrR family transcriptional regulator n=1 Tax=Roseateles asaccharophilus TaxID=582607 RepID=A0ABU2A6C6_9BURK|nr:helix-turn-helix domain-containing protein [Roseateles asaccharophilus]MDR7332753.1 AcrR family transcriptional regulator [Roseateles asaccharophilus]
METRTERAETTLAAIVDTALAMAAAEGLESLSIGEVAKRLGLSKSGVFSRVGSREQLQLAVILEYDRRFMQAIFVPAMKEPRGLPRLDAIMRRWVARATTTDRALSCLYTAGAFEYDDREGAVRDQLIDGVMRLRAALRRTVLQAIEAGHLRADLDIEQFVFELDALSAGLLRDARFLHDPRMHERGLKAWERLLASAKTPGTPH